MSDRKPQIAYAPVDAGGEIEIDCIRAGQLDAEEAFNEAHGEDSWIYAETLDGWRIRRVRIEIDE